ncbi:hypothetical protein [Paenibacillus rhizovicinus]|nr:hypothetical protein [Paenibacillus rhizovicinus]
MPYTFDAILGLISDIRENGVITIRRDRYEEFDSAGYFSMINDFRSILKNAGFDFVEDVLEPGVIWFEVSPSQQERLRYGSSVKDGSGK